MAVQSRSTALQNEVVRLYCTFIRDGMLTNPATQPSVEILDTDGVTVIDTVNAALDNTGFFYADWFVPADLPLGNYYDRWSFQWDASSAVQELTMIISVSSLDSYINFVNRGVSVKTSSRVSQMMLELSNGFIYNAQHIPIYWEQGLRMQQENQAKRTKNYYYFTVSNANSYAATSGDIYSNNSYNYTIFSTFPQQTDTDVALVLTATGNGNPTDAGDLTLVTGDSNSSSTITYTDVIKKVSTFSTIYNFAYRNWGQDPAPTVRVNNRISQDGWHADYDGKIYFSRLMAPEDSVNVKYTFAYFSPEELQMFLKFGLGMMNGLPPASISYNSLETCPLEWEPGILLQAAIMAYKRLIFGWSYQESRIIYGRPEDAQSVLAAWQDLYKSYQEQWDAFGKGVKTLKLPDISIYVTPEYTLPGGRCLSSTTYINCMVGRVARQMTIKDAYFASHNTPIMVESNNHGNISFENVEKIWQSGYKDTYWVKTNQEAIRLTAEHLVYSPTQNTFVNVGSMKKGDVILVNRDGSFRQEKLIVTPYLYGSEEVYDLEVPSTENFIGNGVVSHNSRWFRYLYKSSSG